MPHPKIKRRSVKKRRASSESEEDDLKSEKTPWWSGESDDENNGNATNSTEDKKKESGPNVKLQSKLEKNETKIFSPPTPLPAVLSPLQPLSPYYRHVCKLADVPIKKEISGQDMCRPGRPARLALDKVKLHYVVHYMFRGTWDHIIPEEDQNDLGRIEHYACNLCQRRFRNNHEKKEYPGRGSMLCHVATEHGKLLEAMRNDDKVSMQGEIDLLSQYEKGKFIEKQPSDLVQDSDLVTIKESILWKIRQGKLDVDNNKNTNTFPHREPPKIVPYSKTELADRNLQAQTVENGPLGPRPRRIECPHCAEYKDNSDGSKLRLHIFLHYKDRWEKRIDKLEKGNNYFYCDSCPKRKQLKGANEEGARLSAICHFAIQHHELRAVLKMDDSLPENFVNDLYWDIDSKPKDNPPNTVANNNQTNKPATPANKQTTPASKVEPARQQTPKVPEPTRGRRSKSKGNNQSTKEGENSKATDIKAEWMSSSEEEEDAPSKVRSKRKKRV